MSDKRQETIADIIAEMRGARTEFPFVYLMGEPDTPEVMDLRTKEITEPRKINIRRVTVKELADRMESALKRERGDCEKMFDALVRIGNWCAQDLAENAYTSDSSGNYLKTLNGLCEVCRPYMQKAIKLGDAAKLRESITLKSDPDWKDICAKCKEGDIEPKHCEYYGEPNGCNSPIYGEHPTAEKSSVVGDAAKLREALEATLDLFWDIHIANRSPQSNQAYAVIKQIKAALAAPPRNCDRFASAEEAWDAYDEWVDSYRAQGKTEPYNEFGWLYALATERKGENDGK